MNVADIDLYMRMLTQVSFNMVLISDGTTPADGDFRFSVVGPLAAPRHILPSCFWRFSKFEHSLGIGFQQSSPFLMIFLPAGTHHAGNLLLLG
jgi:hypothetical protein